MPAWRMISMASSLLSPFTSPSVRFFNSTKNPTSVPLLNLYRWALMSRCREGLGTGSSLSTSRSGLTSHGEPSRPSSRIRNRPRFVISPWGVMYPASIRWRAGSSYDPLRVQARPVRISSANSSSCSSVSGKPTSCSLRLLIKLMMTPSFLEAQRRKEGEQVAARPPREEQDDLSFWRVARCALPRCDSPPRALPPDSLYPQYYALENSAPRPVLTK
jgi:hypothetical protein